MNALPKFSGCLPNIPKAKCPEWAEWLWNGFGCDTVEIGEILGIPEADVCRMLVRPGEQREPWVHEVAP